MLDALLRIADWLSAAVERMGIDEEALYWLALSDLPADHDSRVHDGELEQRDPCSETLDLRAAWLQNGSAAP